MKNMRVTSLGDLFRLQTPTWAKSPVGTIQVQRVSVPPEQWDIDTPDYVLLAGLGPISTFDDQRVKLNLNTLELEAKDTHGRVWTLAFGPCPAPS